MKLTALTTIDLFNTRYSKGDTIDVTQETAERLIRSRQARISVHELAAHLAGQRFTTPAGKAAGMHVIKR